MLPLKLKKPVALSAKTSGACGLSKKDTDGVPGVMSVMTCPPVSKKAKVWQSIDGGKTWRVIRLKRRASVIANQSRI
jgi:hypothetical protein